MNLREVRADLPDFLHSAARFFGKLVHAHDAGGDGGLHLLDHLLDVVGGDGGLIGQAADFHGDHGKAQPVFARLFGFDGGIERQQVGLVGDLGDGGDDGVDVGGLLAEDREFGGDGAGRFHDLAHGRFHAGEGGVTAAGKVGGLFGDLVHLVHRLHQLLGGGGDLLGGGADLRRRGGDFVGGALLFPGRRGNLGRGGVDLNARALDLADQFGEVVRQPVEAIAQDAEFIAPLQSQAFGEVALAHAFEGGDQAIQRLGDGRGMDAADDRDRQEDDEDGGQANPAERVARASPRRCAPAQSPTSGPRTACCASRGFQDSPCCRA